jgi:hypothetical protein
VDAGLRLSATSLLKPPAESETITSMSLQDYHQICYWHLFRWHTWSISTNVSVKLGSMHHFSGSEYDSSLEVAYWDSRINDNGWSTMDSIIENCWHRYVQSSYCVTSHSDGHHELQDKLQPQRGFNDAEWLDSVRVSLLFVSF